MTCPPISLVAQLGGRESNPCRVKNIFLFISCKTCSSEGLAAFLTVSTYSITAQSTFNFTLSIQLY